MSKDHKNNSPKYSAGEEVGRLLLRDLAAVYQNYGGGGGATLSAREKADLVNNLVEPADIVRYNEFRYVYEYLTRAAASHLLEESNAQSHFWRLCGLLEGLKMAESENTYFLETLPRVMTKKEREEINSLFPPPPENNYGKGVAVIDTEKFPATYYELDKKGYYQPRKPLWRQESMAENFLEHNKEEIEQLLFLLQYSLKECLVLKTAVSLMSEFLELPEIAKLVHDVDLSQVEQLNNLLRAIPRLIRRRGVFPDELPEKDLAGALKELLKPINIENLKPMAAAIRKARRRVDFSVAQGRAEEFYTILRGGK